MTVALEFRESWSATLNAYWSGVVNSERTLQAHMFAELRARLPDCIVLCEPQINVERHGCFVPDLIVIDGTSVVGLAELKFLPHGYPVYELDLKKLSVLAEGRQSFRLRLDPSSGDFTSDTFSVAPECTLVFAAIGKNDSAAVDAPMLQASMSQFGARFVPLLLGVGQ